MIAHLKGIVEQIDKNFLILDVAGIGYHVFITSSTLSRLPSVGDELKLYTIQVVREDSLSLYGFLTREEKSLFSLLLRVSGVGPKAALSIISFFPIDKLVVAITSGDVDLISTVPGVGKKTAQKLVIELKEKVAKAYAVKPSEMVIGVTIDGEETTLVADAISAMIALGYTPREARRVIFKVDPEAAGSVEAIVKQALQELV